MSRSDTPFESRLVPILISYARARGVDVGPYLTQYRLPSEVLTSPVGKFELETPASVPPALAEQLATQLGDVHLGLSMAAWLPRGAYGVAEFVARTSPTVRSAFENMSRFNAIIAPQQVFRSEVNDREGSLHHYGAAQPGITGRHLQEFSSSVMINTYFELSGGVAPLRAWFVHPKPPNADWARMAEHLKTTEFQFDEATNGFAVPLDVLDRPAVGGDQALYAFLEEHALAALASRPQPDDFIDKLRRLLREALQSGEPNVERVATRLSMSGRTLQRRLAELSTSFQDVLDQVRFDLARAYLKDARLDVSQVAYLLGYSELRAFDRAFRRWANQSPSEWRAQR